MRMKYVSVGAGALFGALLLVVGFLVLSPDATYQEADLSFEFEGTQIVGKLILPTGTRNDPIDCMVFVHGDGAMNFDGLGYFPPYFSHFANKNMCSFSWTKPGVEDAGGNWLDYTMADRAALVEAGVKALRANQTQPIKRVGLIGFSQAGWVMPKVDPAKNDVAFYVFVSPAVNWLRQSAYMSELRRADLPLDPVEQQREQAIDALLLAGSPYAAFEELAAGDPAIEVEDFSPARWAFVAKNMRADLTSDLSNLKDVPVLLLTGGRDGQVDTGETVAAFKGILGDKLVHQQFGTAGHSMIEVDQRRPMQGLDGFWLLLKVAFQGRDAFANGFWAAMDEFIAAAK